MAEEAKNGFVSVRLTEEEMSTLEQVMAAMEPLTGRRSVSDAMRYVIRNFDFAASPLGKAPSLTGVMA